MGTTVFERHPPAPSVVRHALADTAHSVFWRDDLPAELKPERPRLTGSRNADLVIVGRGYTGLWTALLAAECLPGSRIALLSAGLSFGVGGTGLISSASTWAAKKRVASSSATSVASPALPNIASHSLRVCGRSSGFTTIAASTAARNRLV